MENLEYDKCFDVIDPGACLTHLSVFVNNGVIVKCDIKGKCQMNLNVLAKNLVRENLFDATKCFTALCGNDNKPCITELYSVLYCWFKKFEEVYK